jgi:cyclopropane fatty-acyl-phospholipid synthase-like methyltransferase
VSDSPRTETISLPVELAERGWLLDRVLSAGIRRLIRERLRDERASASDLGIVHLEDLTPHHERTLRCWRERFLEKRDAIRDLGHHEELLRSFELCFAYCEAGFSERPIASAQILLDKHESRRPPLLGALPA